ncbi:LPXTG cell wall anchor domain-containing protein [Paramicrobacterium fandaimingii]|uniref:LPXTG cell wall anchor domain-containing protein n=1 Tax=Paramicrobacterium fandaimingii TaxID=2708079 RepID=UPI00141EF1EE|nr:LPXTG cell wall anchor domain-containing protein [Microbacterium fandaimingii]
MKRTLTRCLYGTLIAGGIIFFGSTAANAAEQPSGDEGTSCGCVTNIITDVTDTATDAVDDIVSSATEHGSQPPADDTAPPAEDTAPPAEDTAPPAEDTAPPAEDTAPPAEDTAPPAEDTAPPAEETAPPEEDTAPPAEETTPPAEDTAPPTSGDADADSATSGDDSVAGGTNASPVVNIPITANGISVSGLGDATATGVATGAGASDPVGAASGASTSGDDGIASGTAVAPVVTVPVDLGGLAIAGLGDASTTSAGAWVPEGNAGASSAPVGGTSDVVTSGDDSVVGGSVVDPTATLPISLRGLAVSVIGDSATSGATTGAAADMGASDPVGAASGASTSGDDGIASGTAVAPVVTVPVDLGGLAIAGLGDASTTSAGAWVPEGNAGASSAPVGGTSDVVTSGDDSVVGGSVVDPTATLPISLRGLAVSVIGDSATSGATTGAAADMGASDPVGAASGASTSGDDGIASGTAVAPVVTVPVDLGGLAIAGLGDASTTRAGAWVPEGNAGAGSAPVGGTSDVVTSGDDSVAGGTAVSPVVDIPVDLAGIAVSGLGDATSSGGGDVSDVAPADADSAGVASNAVTSGDDSIAGGSVVSPAVEAPITVNGSAVSVVGDSTTSGAATTVDTEGAVTEPVADLGSQSSGDDSVLGGSVVDGPVDAPVTANGNAISVIGDSTTSGASTVSEGSAGVDSPMTSGDDSVLGGSLIDLETSVPVTIGGNAISVIGDSTTEVPSGTDDPGTDDPETDNPETDNPETDNPGTDDPGADNPGTDDPSADEPDSNDPDVLEHGSSDSGASPAASSVRWSNSGASQELPETGADGSTAVLGLAALLLLAGAGVKLAGRKRALRRR